MTVRKINMCLESEFFIMMKLGIWSVILSGEIEMILSLERELVKMLSSSEGFCLFTTRVGLLIVGCKLLPYIVSMKSCVCKCDLICVFSGNLRQLTVFGENKTLRA